MRWKLRLRSCSKILPVLILSLSLVMIAFGCARGELDVVLGKAVTICMECIGLG